MSRITVVFERAWLDKRRSEGVRIVRLLEKWLAPERRSRRRKAPTRNRPDGWRKPASICRNLFGLGAPAVAAAFAACLACSASQAQASAAVGNMPATNSVAGAVRKEGLSLRAENEALKAENEALRRENQMLRRELISKNGALPDSLMPEKGVARDDGLEPVDKETGYWISAKTKVRHNKRCRNYRRVKGHPCGPNDGRPCKSCGG